MLTFRHVLLAALAVACLACRSPLIDLRPGWEKPTFALTVASENHSRKLTNLWTPTGETDLPAARAAAIERHRNQFEADVRGEAAARGLRLEEAAALRLDLTITSLGEVRAKYIAWGIASGVAWGVGTGLIAHNTRLAVGLGVYELLEESAFWIGGSLLMGRWSSPAVVEAKLFRPGQIKPLWEETYHVLWASRELNAFPPKARRRREHQLQASLRKVIGKLFEDLEDIPEFPKAITPPQAPLAPAPSPATAPGPRRRG